MQLKILLFLDIELSESGSSISDFKVVPEKSEVYWDDQLHERQETEYHGRNSDTLARLARVFVGYKLGKDENVFHLTHILKRQRNKKNSSLNDFFGLKGGNPLICDIFRNEDSRTIKFNTNVIRPEDVLIRHSNSNDEAKEDLMNLIVECVDPESGKLRHQLSTEPRQAESQAWQTRPDAIVVNRKQDSENKAAQQQLGDTFEGPDIIETDTWELRKESPLPAESSEPESHDWKKIAGHIAAVILILAVIVGSWFGFNTLTGTPFAETTSPTSDPDDAIPPLDFSPESPFQLNSLEGLDPKPPVANNGLTATADRLMDRGFESLAMSHFAIAKGEFDQAYEIYEEYFGKNALPTLDAHRFLARAHYCLGEYDQAKQIQENIKEKLLKQSIDKKLTCIILGDLALSRLATGEDTDDYERLATSLLDVDESDRKAIRIAAIDIEMMKILNLSPEELKPILSDMVSQFEAEFGEHHPYTISAMSVHAVQFESDNYERAIQLLEKTRQRCKDNIADENLAKTICFARLVKLYGREWNSKEIHSLLEKLQRSYDAVIEKSGMPEDHPILLDIATNLSTGYVMVGMVDEGFTLMEQTIANAESRFGANHPNTRRGRLILATQLKHAIRIPEAIEEFENVKASYELENRPPSDPELRAVEESLRVLNLIKPIVGTDTGKKVIETFLQPEVEANNTVPDDVGGKLPDSEL